MRFNSRRSEGLNLKGAGMKKIIHQYRQMSLLQCTSYHIHPKFEAKPRASTGPEKMVRGWADPNFFKFLKLRPPESLST
jgi:hypothetical protein